MRIFICWSGDRARELGRVLRGWLPKVVESVEPFFSEEIPSGRVWRETLSRKLRSKLDNTQLTARFEEAWPDLDTVLHRLKAISIEAAVPGFRDLFEHKTFLEPLDECSDCRWSDRLERLGGVRELVERLAPRTPR